MTSTTSKVVGVVRIDSGRVQDNLGTQVELGTRHSNFQLIKLSFNYYVCKFIDIELISGKTWKTESILREI